MSTIKTWQENAAFHLPDLRNTIDKIPFVDVRASYMVAEIAELRAALAASGGNAAPGLTNERAAFEADTLDLYPVATFNRFPNSENYNVNWVQEQWGGWQRRAKYAAASAPNAALVAAQDSISWEPLTAAGQIGKHDLVRFDLCGEKKVHKVALILNAGTGQEEIIYHRRNNWYLITSMSIKGEGNQKNVEFLPVSSALSAAGQEVVE